MGRSARMVFPEFAHHVTQRGNRRQDVFRDDRDRRKFLELLAHYLKRDSIDIWSYTLMRNHIHLIAVPNTKDGLSTAMRDCLSDYALFFNQRYSYKGHLWQARFYSSVLGTDHLWNAVRYVERNPVRAGIVDRAENYVWSSAAFHCGLRVTDPIIRCNSPLIGAVPDWSAWLNMDERPGEFDLLRRNTNLSRPTASEEFQQMLERLCGRPVLPRKRGPKLGWAKKQIFDCIERKQDQGIK
jgi:putative transposase